MYKIAICGKANSGKNLTATIIASKLCQNKTDYKIMAFADPIKKIALQMFPWLDANCLYGPSSLRNNIIAEAINNDGFPLTYRQLLVDIGEQCRRYNECHWIKLFDYEYKISKHKLIICSDLRFPNEFNYLKSQGFLIIKLLRNSEPLSSTINLGNTETSQDAIKLDNFDYIVENNQDVAALELKINDLIDKCGYFSI